MANYKRERGGTEMDIDIHRSKFPFCIVWTPIPLLTWFFPVIGHMGIAHSSGVIRDFAGPYYVAEDEMAFGKPTKYWLLDPLLAEGGIAGWDRAVLDASEEYKNRVHNLVCDNCHSHCALALNQMRYNGSKSWNMVWLALYMLQKSRYVSFTGFLKTWVPFLIMVTIVTLMAVFL